jgi:L1 cell adhesion molecule like protein
MDIYVYEGERTMAEDNSLRGWFTLSGLTLAPMGVTQVNVRFEVDADGILHVSAQDKKSAQRGNITIVNDPGRFSMDEIKRMLEEAQEYNTVDKEHKKRALARNDIDNLLYTMRNNVKNLRGSAKRVLQDTIDGTEKWLQNTELKSRQLNAKKTLLEDIIGQTSTQ